MKVWTYPTGVAIVLHMLKGGSQEKRELDGGAGRKKKKKYCKLVIGWITPTMNEWMTGQLSEKEQEYDI